MFNRWQALDSWLSEHAAFWQPVPFYTPQPDWAVQYPELYRALQGLSAEDYAELQRDEAAITDWLIDWLPALSQRASLLEGFSTDESAAQTSAWVLTEAQAPHMPERKRIQAGVLTGCLQPLSQPITDWCSGMGHLARTLAAASGQPVTGLEWNPELVDRGEQLIQASHCPHQTKVTLQQQDVLQLQAKTTHWPDTPHLVALHACGDLHRHLLYQAAMARQTRISLVPCCYHLTADTHWQPLAKVTRQSALHGLTQAQMRLAVQETVTAPARVTEQREQLNVWRLGYEALRQSLAQDDTYRPLPSSSVKQLQHGFPAFCHWAASQHAGTLPSQVDWPAWLHQGEQRYAQVLRDELLRHQFRRPLELWLVLDYVLFLQEAGYQVKLQTFCARELSPRNLLIEARYQH
ncbi:methyltransferase [Nitrincola alkalilacustris]|uniref:methyltransferase n=1 Tax=Nitrincola alkalilacustris TaxID=1571224 RepID=UPI00124DCB95|nr:methyltransferase [Nitrincola alkalilacustris]